jgi:hypothetical protein
LAKPAVGLVVERVHAFPPPWIVGVLGLVIGIIVALRILIPNGMDATPFIALGEDSPAISRYVEERLQDPVTRPLGHDGKFFFIQANDPWLLHPAETGAVLDRPFYRGQRMLFPLIAGGFGAFPPELIVWAMLATNLLALGAGAWLAAVLATGWGLSPWLGLAVPLNIGLLFEIWIGGAGVLAFAFGLAALYALSTGRNAAAVVLMTMAALTREVMVGFAAGIVVLDWIQGRRRRWRLVAVPLAAMALWHAYLRLRLTGIHGLGASWPIVDLPFVGLARAVPRWTDTGELITTLAILAVVGAFILAARRSRLPIVWGALPFAGLATVLSVQVWLEPSDLSRALAPVFTAAPFLIVRPGRRDDVVEIPDDVVVVPEATDPSPARPAEVGE